MKPMKAFSCLALTTFFSVAFAQSYQSVDVENLILSGESLPTNPNEYYLLGDIADAAYQRGDIDRAVALYIALMRAYPDWPRPALDLALIYLEQARFTEAKALLESQLNTALPPEVESAMIRLLRQLKNQNQFYYDIDATLSPDNNINNATFNKTISIFGIPFEVNPDSKPKSDIILTVSGKVGYKIPINVRSKIVAQFDAETSWYKQYSDYNQQRYGIELRYSEQVTPQSQFELSFRHARSYSGDDYLTAQNRLSGNYLYAWKENCWWQASPSFEVGTNEQNNIYDYQAFALNAATSPCWERGQISLGLRRHEATSPAYTYDEKSIGISALLVDKPMVNWHADAKIALRNYDQASFGQKAPREDRNLQVTTRVGFPKVRPWKYYYPSLSVKYSRNYSTYDYFDNEKWQAFVEFKREY